jgi:hypothetical protein
MLFAPDDKSFGTIKHLFTAFAGAAKSLTRICSCVHTILTRDRHDVAQRSTTQWNPTLFAFYDTAPVVEFQANQGGRPPRRAAAIFYITKNASETSLSSGKGKR